MNAPRLLRAGLITALTCLAPLLGQPALLTHPFTFTLVVSSLLMLLTQPVLRWQDLSVHRSTDRLTMPLIVVTVIGTQMASLAEWAYFRADHRITVGPGLLVGAGLLVGGIGLRTWAIALLNRHFTASVTVGREQPLVRRGPYACLRHPSYTGALLWVSSTPVLLGNTLTTWLTPLLLLGAYLLRIRAEERELLAAFGRRYRHYQRTTWRLMPFVW